MDDVLADDEGGDADATTELGEEVLAGLCGLSDPVVGPQPLAEA